MMTLEDLNKFAEENGLANDVELMISMDGVFSTNVNAEVSVWDGKTFLDICDSCGAQRPA